MPSIARRLVALLLLGILQAVAHAETVTVGVALPRGPLLPNAEAAEPLRQQLIRELKARSVDAVPLNASADALLSAEAQSQHCRFVLLTHVDKRAGALKSKLSMLTGALHFGPGAGNSIAPPSTGNAAGAALKQGESGTFDYRLMAVGATDPLRSDSIESRKASVDGEDVFGPLAGQIADAVRDAASKPGPQTTAASDEKANHGSPFGGLFGRRSIANNKPSADSMAANMDCAKVASMPNSSVTVASCEQMKAAQLAYSAASKDPTAARPGDDQMTCTQITAELKQQQFTAPDAKQRAGAAATATDIQTVIQRDAAAMAKSQAEAQAAVSAANAADRATELATGGLVRGRALNATEKALEAKHETEQAQLTRENLPAQQRTIGEMASLSSTYADQLKANPRLARLMQLADAKRCHGGY